MRNMLALIGLVVVTFCGVGWYRGWYSFEMSPGESGKQRIQVDVDTDRIKSDAKEATQRIEQIAKDPNAPAAPSTVKVTETSPATSTAKVSEFVGPPAPAELKIGGFRFQVSPATRAK
ncbi:MAG: hypothetical protein ACRC7O_10565 [Fimbriiglobus sp.]